VSGFDPSRCDLCGSGASRRLPSFAAGRALRSDRTVVDEPLLKLECTGCGLVRDGRARGADELAATYAGEYVEHGEDHVFHTPAGPVPRSRLLADWLVDFAGEHRFRRAGRAVEIGAGTGHVMAAVAARLPGLELTGVEPGAEAAARGRALGRSVLEGSADLLEDGRYGLAWSVAVIEHVASPRAFLLAARRTLAPGGWLVLCQPTQDVASNDILFVDHLHHFGTAHVRAYAASCGFVERGFVVGHASMPNFSVHLLERHGEPGPSSWSGPPALTTCAPTLQRLVADMARLDATLDALCREGRRVAVFGTSEVYAMARAYSRLGETPLLAGLEDGGPKPHHGNLPFPVVAPEEAPALGVQDVVVAINAVWLPQVEARLARLGLRAHAVLSA
jgi:SAM-dependent methyltransferase